MVKHGTIVTLEAAPDRGNMFVKWEDGNTLNPYRYVVTDNCTLKGSFAASNMPVGNENVSVPAVRICTTGSFCIFNLLKFLSCLFGIWKES